MIEVVYTPKENGNSNDVIRLPKNIKQIGDIKNSRKIYIEDYAINFIEEAHMNSTDKQIGVLLGRSQKSGSDRYVFIKGAVLVPDIFASESEIVFAESDWSYIYEISGKYFPGQDIVGWFISVDSVNASLLRTMKKVHMDQFAGGEKTLFVFDRQENDKYFCIYENNQLVRQNGYIVYYERNEDMQEYMVDMRGSKSVEDEKVEGRNRQITNQGSYRSMVSGEEKVIQKESNKQSFINYCANVAMVVLVLFVGMYMMDGKNDNIQQSTQTDSITTTKTPIVKVDGDVYPTTEAVTESNPVSGEISEEITNETTVEIISEVSNEVMTTTAGELENVLQETGGSYITINNSVTETTTQTIESVTEKETVKATEAAATYVEHRVAKGESLLTICRKYYGDTTRVEEIMKLNDIEDMDKIYEGQVIKLP